MNFEDITFESLLKEKLAAVSSKLDTRESSVLYNALAPNAAETIQMYIALKMLEDRTYADTATGDDLTKRCAERGITRKSATKAILKAEFNIDVPLSARFSGEDLNYTVVEKINNGVYKLECEAVGETGNSYLGTLIPIDYIKGLTKAEITELLIPGEDAENDETLRKRYFDGFDSQAFGGNKADYKEKTNSIAGVGGTKVYPVWNGGGTVKLAIIDSAFKVPSTELLNIVQTTIDPEQNQGEGQGLAPIGHIVTVTGVAGVIVNISSNITLKTGYVWQDVESYIKTSVEEYLSELRKTWQDSDSIVVRIAYIESRILNVAGVEDIKDTFINGIGENLTLTADEIPILGEVVSI